MERLLELAEQYQLELAIIGGIIVVLILAWLAWRALRKRRGGPQVERRTDTVRRPLYLDGDLLDDLRAHGDATASGSVDAGTAEDAATPAAATPGTESETGSEAGATRARTEETRRLADTIAALEGSEVLIDLDADPDAELSPGKAVLLTGTLHRHAASDAAEILELSAPLLQRAGTNGHGEGDGDTTTTPARAEEATADHAPLVVELRPPSTKNRYLMVLPRTHLRVEDPTREDTVSVMAVIDRVVGRRDTLPPEDYLGPHLSGQGNTLLEDRDLTETITTLSEVANEELDGDELPFKGPGALLTAAAIYR